MSRRHHSTPRGDFVVRVSVAGGSAASDPIEVIAEDLDRLLIQRDRTVVYGGLGGVMRATCRGAKDVGSTTIDVLPDKDRENANSYVDILTVAGLGHTRSALVAMSGDAVIVVDGDGGTPSETGYTNVFDHPMADIRVQQVGPLEGLESCDSPEAAVAFIEDAV